MVVVVVVVVSVKCLLHAAVSCDAWRQTMTQSVVTGRRQQWNVCQWCLARDSTLTAAATASLAQWLRRPSRERKIPGSNPACDGIFSGSSHTSGLKIGTPVATLPGAWRYRVSAGTCWPCVSIL